jgi:broad specificity phosphatase PhoE
MPYLYLVRHPRTHVDPMQQPHEWELSTQGRAQAQMLGAAPFWKKVNTLYASNQQKAIEAAEIVAAANGIPVVPLAGLAEVGRGHEFYSSATDYNNILERFFTQPDSSVSGWESSGVALQRFKAAVDSILSQPITGSVALLSHGTILTLYTALLDGEAPTLARWQNIHFASVATVTIETMRIVESFTAQYEMVPTEQD